MTGRVCKSVELALKMVCDGATIAEACRTYGVNRTTIRYHRKKLGMPMLNPGRPKLVSQQQENK